MHLGRPCAARLATPALDDAGWSDVCVELMRATAVPVFVEHRRRAILAVRALLRHDVESAAMHLGILPRDAVPAVPHNDALDLPSNVVALSDHDRRCFIRVAEKLREVGLPASIRLVTTLARTEEGWGTIGDWHVSLGESVLAECFWDDPRGTTLRTLDIAAGNLSRFLNAGEDDAAARDHELRARSEQRLQVIRTLRRDFNVFWPKEPPV